MNQLRFIGGINDTNKWLNDGKSYSRNFKQGNRVYDSKGISTALSAQPVGGLGGATSLYLVDENTTSKYKGAMRLAIDKKIQFKYAELFAGIGGFRQALDPLGGQCVFASEIDKFAQKAYTALYGDEHLQGDIKKIDAKDVFDHDVLVGGFPCQSFSVAGKRLGFDDKTRGTLFFEIIRIMKEKKPKIALLENVKGLAGHDKGRTLETVVRTLSDIGYAVDFEVLNSKYFGVPQNRERVFIVAVRDDLVTPEPWRIEGTNVVAKGKRRIAEIDGVKTFNFEYPTQGEVTVRLRDILEDDVDERYYLSEEKTAKLVAQLEERGIKEQAGIEYDRRFGVGKTRETALCLSASDWRGLNRNQTQTAVAETRAVLTPDRPEKRQNGRRFKDDGEESFTLTAQDKHGVAIGEYPRYRIRKLTPLECWRLQGFSDLAHETVKLAGVSDSQRYKQAGNAVTVNVIEALMKPLLRYLES